MLQIIIPEREVFDESQNAFLYFSSFQIQLEHSLRSIAEWESRTHRSFFDGEKMSTEDFLEYIRCMTLTKNVDPNEYMLLTEENYRQIAEYMSDPMSAKHFYQQKKDRKRPNQGSMTSEDLYYLMSKFEIPYECDKWHFNRLIALIRTFENKDGEKGGKAMTYMEQQRWFSQLNDARRAKLGTKG